MQRNTMLNAIDLYVLENIFNQSVINLKPMTKMVYISCITSHFKNVPLKIQNNQSFEIPYSTFDYNKFTWSFTQLHKAGLVILKDKVIYFPAVWYEFVDPQIFNKERQGLINKIDPFIEEMNQNIQMKEIVCMKNQINMKQCNSLLELFHKEQKSTGNIYKDVIQATKHFQNWVKFNKDQIQQNTVKSSSKILGLNDKK